MRKRQGLRNRVGGGGRGNYPLGIEAKPFALKRFDYQLHPQNFKIFLRSCHSFDAITDGCSSDDDIMHIYELEHFNVGTFCL